MTVFNHQVSVVVEPSGRRIPGWKNYSITVDMLEPADDFNMSVRLTRETWDLLRMDAKIGVYIDDVRILTGFIGSKFKTSDKGSGSMIEISGRDKCGRLVDESIPSFSFGGLRLKGLVEKIIGVDELDPLFDEVILVNTKNRSLLRRTTARQPTQFIPDEQRFASRAGPRREQLFRIQDGRVIVKPSLPSLYQSTPVSRPPIIEPGILEGRAKKRRSPPGSSRWQVLELFLKEARLLAWSTGDGTALFVGVPEYEQEPQYSFFEAAEGSDRREETNCKISIMQSNEDRYSKITVVGAKTGGKEHGKNRTRLRATVFENPDNKVDGTGLLFQRRKELIVADDSIRNIKVCLERAERVQAERDRTWLEVGIELPGHGQSMDGTDPPALFAVDTMCKVHDEATDIRGDFMVTRVNFVNNRQSGMQTQLSTVPRGTLLTL